MIIIRRPIPSLLLLLLVALAASPAALARTVRPSSIVVHSTPAGATVFLDGQPVDQAPATLNTVSIGAHDVSVALPGYGLWTRHVQLRSGERVDLQAKLKRTALLDSADKAARVARVSQETGRIRGARETVSMAFTTPGVLGLLGLGPGLGVGSNQDPTSGLYANFSVSTDANGDLVVAITYYQDPQLTEPVGSITLTVSLTQITETYTFSLGPLAGANGTLTILPTSVTASSLGATVTGSGANPDGSTFTLNLTLTVSLADSTGSLTGTVDITSDGTTTTWTITATATSQTLQATTSDGYALSLQVNPDGSGSGTFTGPGGATLAVFSWNANGSGTITYSDGTTSTFQVPGE